MAQWVNKYAIMRDLSRAQGRVPGRHAVKVFQGDRPPSSDIKEDTEEEFYRHFMGEGDFAAPDLGLIKQMLDVVKDQDSDGEEESTEKVIQISKLNPLSPDFYPKDIKKVIKQPQKEKKVESKKIRKERNVAMTSLLKQFEKENTNIEANITQETKQNNNNNNLLLLTPEDFSPETMFKKRLSPKKIKGKKVEVSNDFKPETLFKKRVETSTPVFNKSPENGSYVPSDNVNQYYKKFLENSKMKQMLNDNVWSKAERQMKELDERRKIEADLFAASLALSQTLLPIKLGDPGGIESKILDVVRLPQHRHLLTGECVVCSVKNKTIKSNCDDKNGSTSDCGSLSELSWRQ